MSHFFKRHFFMGLAALGLAAMAIFVVGRALWPDGGDDSGGPPAAAAQAKGGGGPPGAQGKGGGGPGGPGGGGVGGGPGGGRPAVVVVQAAETRDFSSPIQTIGAAQANESITLTSKVTDVISAISYESGQRVQRGQVLVTLANTEQQGDLLTARGDLSAVRAQIVEAEASAREAQLQYERQRDLGDRGFASPARIDQAKAAADTARARVEAARQRLNGAEGRVTAIQSRAQDRVIRAPFSGVMGLRDISVGELARPGDVLGTLDDTSVMKVDFDIPEAQLSQVGPGTMLTVRSDALAGEAFEARITVMDSRVDPRTRTVKARALVPNPTGRIKPGMVLTGRVAARPRQAVAVPESALVDDGAQTFVFTVDRKAEGGPRVARNVVQVGVRKDGYAEIMAGVAAGAPVITEGLVRLRPGSPVRILGEAPPGRPQASGQPGAGERG
jgi:membrane fusion protein (multidrug efflux system)